MSLFRSIFLAFAFTAAFAAEVKTDAPAPRNSDGIPFVHPGIFYTQGDLDRMKAMVAAGREPWKRAFEELKASRFSNPGIWSRPRGGEIPEGRFNVTVGIDGRSAHDIALLWKLTGDEAYAKNAREFLVNNSNYTGTSWAGTGPLDNGKIFLLIEAAELMRDYPEWTREEQDKFGKMLREVFYPHIKGGDVMRWGNQGLMAWHGVLAMAIYLDDRKMYDRVWNNVMGLPHRPDDEPYAPGGAWSPDWPADFGETMITRRNHPVLGQEPDWGYGDQLQHYIYRNGQTEESCRDQPHATFGLFQMVSLAEIFWNQGDDLYGALDDRILTGIEWTLRYNQSDWEPSGYTNDEAAVSFENGLFLQTRTRNNRWTALKPSPAGRGSDGGPGAPKTAAIVHYGIRKGVPKDRIKWLLEPIKRQMDAKDVERWGFGANWYYEYEGWGTLTKARTSHQHGDPGTWRDGARVSGAHAVPGAVKAVDFDFHTAGTNAKHTTWRCPGPAVKPSKYRPDAAMPITMIEGRWCLGPLRKGEWAEYTLTVPETRKYKVEIIYRNLGTCELSLSADGGSPLVRRLPKAEKLRKFSLGEIELAAGAPVLKLAVDAASASAVYGIALK